MDELLAELFKIGRSDLVKAIQKLIAQVLEDETIPSYWTESLVVPIYKRKGDSLVCDTHRGISLLNTSIKSFRT